MLENLKRLKDTVTNAQVRGFRDRLGGDGWDLFKRLLDSQTEEQASTRREEFRAIIQKLGIQQLLSMHMLLDDEQKEMVADLL